MPALRTNSLDLLLFISFVVEGIRSDPQDGIDPVAQDAYLLERMEVMPGMKHNVRGGGSDGWRIRYAMKRLGGGLGSFCEHGCRDEESREEKEIMDVVRCGCEMSRDG